jgi:HlyD family secretion protein
MPSAGQVPRPRARWLTRSFIPAAILLSAAGLLAYTARDALRPAIGVHVIPVVPVVHTPSADSAAAPQPTDVQGSQASAGAPSQVPGEVLAQAPGWIEPAPHAVSIAALTEGVVSEVLVLEGERVEAGQVVVRLVNEDAILSRRMAEATLESRRAEYAGALTAIETARAMARVEWSAAEEVEDDLNRKKDLVGGGAIAAGDVRRLEIRLAGLQARALAADGMIEEAKAAALRLASTIEADRAALDEAALRQSRTEIRSAVSGVVLSRFVEPGTRIMIGSESGETSGMAGVVMRIYDPSKLQVRVDVPLADAAKIAPGTPAIITTEALPGSVFEGVVMRAVHEANIQRNTVQFKVSINSPSPVLKPEMLTRVRLHSRASAQPIDGGTVDHTASSQRLLVPANLIEHDSPGARSGHLWLVDSRDGLTFARRAAVECMPTDTPGFVHITRGVVPSDRVIADPARPLHDGARIAVIGEKPTSDSDE